MVSMFPKFTGKIHYVLPENGIAVNEILTQLKKSRKQENELSRKKKEWVGDFCSKKIKKVKKFKINYYLHDFKDDIF